MDASVQVNITAETNEKGTQADIPRSVIDESCQVPPPPLDEDTLKNVTLAIKKDHSYAKPVELKTLPKTQCTTGVTSKPMPLVHVETVSSIDSSTQEAMASVGTSLSELLLKSAADKKSTREEIFKANQFTTASRPPLSSSTEPFPALMVEEAGVPATSTPIKSCSTDITDTPNTTECNMINETDSDIENNKINLKHAKTAEHDTSFHISDHEQSFDALDDTIESETEYSFSAESIVKERKFIIFESSLDSLLMRILCNLCGKPVNDCKKYTKGTAIICHLNCINGHQMFKWSSQPYLGKMPAGNLLCSAATFFSGETHTHLNNFCKFINLQFIGHTKFYEIQSNLIIPIVNETYDRHINGVQNEIKGMETWFSGDARFDSPGFSTKYGSYSLMAQLSKKIVTTKLVHVSEAGSSQGCEKEGFIRCRNELKANNIPFELLATDRHPGISKYMKELDEEDLEYDLWHVAKSVKKKLFKASKKKGCAEIAPWIKSISDHLWWCSETSKGNAELLIQRWLSLKYHVANIHDWTIDGRKSSCCHEPLSAEKVKKTKWLKPGSAAHLEICGIISEAKLLKDLHHCTKACHTAELEVFHSLCTKYCPKREEFEYEIMDARMKCAVMDHNENCQRNQAVIKKSQPGTANKGEARFRCPCSKQTKEWNAKPVLEDKSYKFVEDMMVQLVDRKSKSSMKKREKTYRPLDLPRNIAPVPMPPKEELIKNRKEKDKKRIEARKKTTGFHEGSKRKPSKKTE